MMKVVKAGNIGSLILLLLGMVMLSSLSFSIQFEEALVNPVHVNNIGTGNEQHFPIYFDLSTMISDDRQDGKGGRVVISFNDEYILASYSVNKDTFPTFNWNGEVYYISNGTQQEVISYYTRYYPSSQIGDVEGYYKLVFGKLLSNGQFVAFRFYPNGTLRDILKGWKWDHYEDNILSQIKTNKDSILVARCNATSPQNVQDSSCVFNNSSLKINDTYTIVVSHVGIEDNYYYWEIFDPACSGCGFAPSFGFHDNHKWEHLVIDNHTPYINTSHQLLQDVLVVSFATQDDTFGPHQARSSLNEAYDNSDSWGDVQEFKVFNTSDNMAKYLYFMEIVNYTIYAPYSCIFNNISNSFVCTRQVPMWNAPDHFPIGKHKYEVWVYDRAGNKNMSSTDYISYSFSGVIPPTQDRYIILSSHDKFNSSRSINNSLVEFNNGSVDGGGALLILKNKNNTSAYSVEVHNVEQTSMQGLPNYVVLVNNQAYEINITTNASMYICFNYTGLGFPEDSITIYTNSGGSWHAVSGVIKADGLVCGKVESAHTTYGLVGEYTCSDGTPYGECSATKPKYCDNGVLIDKCGECGCKVGVCSYSTGECISYSSGGGGGGSYVTAYCGDGICNGDENCDTCSQDCGECQQCGNGILDEGEQCEVGNYRVCTSSNGYKGIERCGNNCKWSGTCIATERCGDNICNGNEDCSSCPQDCGTCNNNANENRNNNAGAVCGNGVCDAGETCSSCPEDCGTCPPPVTPNPTITGRIIGFTSKNAGYIAAVILLLVAIGVEIKTKLIRNLFTK